MVTIGLMVTFGFMEVVVLLAMVLGGAGLFLALRSGGVAAGEDPDEAEEQA